MSTQTSGVGARYGVVFRLNTSGLPYQAVSSATPETGVQVSRLKSLSVSDPEAQRFTHYGDDYPYAQDALAPTEGETYEFTTAQTNFDLDAYLAGTKVYQVGSELSVLAANTDRVGNEPQVMLMMYRQALDTNPASATFGSRRYEMRIYPKTTVQAKSQPFEQGITDKTYQGTPTPTRQTEYGMALTEADFGCTQTTHFDEICFYHPRINVWRGNGTLTTFNLSHTPVSASYLKVWVNGSLVTPSTVTLGSTPSFTLGTAPSAGQLIYALIQTAEPG